MVGASRASDVMVRPVIDRTLLAVPAKCKTIGTMTAVPGGADYCGRGEALGFASPGELP